jgi:hypothetical protein
MPGRDCSAVLGRNRNRREARLAIWRSRQLSSLRLPPLRVNQIGVDVMTARKVGDAQPTCVRRRYGAKDRIGSISDLIWFAWWEILVSSGHRLSDPIRLPGRKPPSGAYTKHQLRSS